MNFLQEVTEEFFQTVYNYYWQGIAFFSIYCVSILYVLRKKGVEKYVFGYSAVIALLTVFNANIAAYFVDKYGIHARYYRFYWILPVAMLLALIFTEFIGRCRKWYDKVIAILLVIIIISSFGTRGSYGEAKANDNIYKIDSEIIQVSEIIHQYTEQEYIRIYNDWSLMVAIQTYDASLIPVMGRSQYYEGNVTDAMVKAAHSNNYILLQLMEFYGKEFPKENVHAAFEQYGVECFISVKDKYSEGYIDTLEFEKIGETENYEVYWCK